MGTKRQKANYMIQSVAHALEVLEEMSKAGGEIGVTELSKRLDLHKNNVFRLLATLELRGFVEQNPSTENYRLGVKNLQLGQSYMAHNTLVQRSGPVLRKLAEETGETVSLAMLQNGYVQFPITVASKKPVKVAAREGTSFPAKMNAAGRLLTAQMSDASLAELLGGDTPQDVAIKSQLTELRSSGQIIDRGAIEADVVSMCRVVRGMNGEVVGAIELLVPQYRATKIEATMAMVEEAVNTLSGALGSYRVALSTTVEREVTSKVTPATMQTTPAV